MEKQVSGFYGEMYSFVKKHAATDNDFINRFAEGRVSESEFLRFAVEFYHFTREWPAILSTLLVNTPDENDAASLTTILVSELGDTDPWKRHELLYRKFLRSIGLEPRELVGQRKLPTTQAWLDGMRNYFSGDHFEALGAEFGLENMAIPMWDKLLPRPEEVEGEGGRQVREHGHRVLHVPQGAGGAPRGGNGERAGPACERSSGQGKVQGRCGRHPEARGGILAGPCGQEVTVFKNPLFKCP